jgi:hypothetical protein
LLSNSTSISAGSVPLVQHREHGPTIAAAVYVPPGATVATRSPASSSSVSPDDAPVGKSVEQSSMNVVAVHVVAQVSPSLATSPLYVVSVAGCRP